MQTLEFFRQQQKLNKDLDGIDFLREMVEALNNRNETVNEDKTPMQLMLEYVNEFETRLS